MKINHNCKSFGLTAGLKKAALRSLVYLLVLGLSAQTPLSFAAAQEPRGLGAAGIAPPTSTALPTTAEAPRYERGTLLVKFIPTVGDALLSAQANNRSLSSALPRSLLVLQQKYGVSAMESAFKSATVSPARLAQIRNQFPARMRRAVGDTELPRLDHIFKLTFNPQIDSERMAQDYAADANVEFAEPNLLITPSFLPNDQYYPQLWGLNKVQALSAWNKADGNGVLVAVIDTGLDVTHPDLNGNLAVNTAELNGLPGVDDDGNGYVDDMYGWNFVNQSNQLTDNVGHGTHVAGTIAATGYNQIGVIGLAYKSRVLPVKGLDVNGGNSTDLANAITYAVARGADVINNSWGGYGTSVLFENVITYAHANGVVVVCAAGNNSQNSSNTTPANVKRAVAVSATTPSDTRATYSNFGHQIDVAAPGGSGGPAAISTSSNNILSSLPNPSQLQSSGIPLQADYTGHQYGAVAGTSMAAPHVAALAALLVQAHPAWTNEEIRQAMRQSANDIATPGFDTDSGYGRINAANAMALGNTALPTALLTKPANYQTVSGNVQVRGYARTATNSLTFELQVGAGDLPTTFTTFATGYAPVVNGMLGSLNTYNLPDGTYTLRLVATDANGQRSEDRVVLTVDNVFLVNPIDHQLFANGIYQLTGQIAGNNCTYKLEWAAGCNATKYFNFITSGPAQSSGVNLIGLWNTANVPDGEITLRLTATCGSIVTVEQRCVVVDKLLAPGWPVAIDQTPSLKSPKVADLDGDGKNEIVLGAAVFNADGTVKTGWTNAPGAGRTNPAILNVDSVAKTLEVVAAVYDDDPSKPYPDTPVVTAYRYDKSVLWSFPVTNPDGGCSGKDRSIPSSISAADVDGDWKMDIIFTAFFPDCLDTDIHTWVYVLDAATGKLKQQFKVTGISKSNVALADMDGDEVNDLLIASLDFDRTQNPSPGIGRMNVVKANGTPLPGWPQVVTTQGSNEGWDNIDPVVADVDGDCRYEVLVGGHLWKSNGTLFNGWPDVTLARSTGALVPLADGDPQWEVIGGGANGVLYRVFDHDATYKAMAFKSYENLYVFHYLLINVPNPALGMLYLAPQGNPIVADIDGDGQPEVVRGAELGHTAPTIGMRLYGIKPLTGQAATSFPRYVNTTNPAGWADPIYSTAAVADVDKDGKTDVVVAAGGKLYLWNLGKTYNVNVNPWPMFQRDLRNTGTAPLGFNCSIIK